MSRDHEARERLNIIQITDPDSSDLSLPLVPLISRFQPTQESADIPPLPILIDSISLTLLQGSTIDYVTELIGSQFAIKDNPQAKGAGCGCGVSWEPIV